MCLKLNTIDEEDHSTVTAKRLNTRAKPHVGEESGVEAFDTIFSVGHVVQCSYGTPPLSRTLPWPYHCLHINGFYNVHLLKLGSTEME